MTSVKFTEADTVVFWDVNDFPIISPDRSYLETLRSVLGNNGYSGELKITAYGEKKPKNLGDGITFVRKKGKYSRLNRMLLDMAFWALDTSDLYQIPKNVMVIAENIEEDTEMVNLSFNLRINTTNVLLVMPDDHREKIKRVKIPSASFIWTWQDLLAGKDHMAPELVYELRKQAIRGRFDPLWC